MLPPQLNLACTAMQNIDKVSLHTADPGNTGDNDSGLTKQTLTWTTPKKGYMRATATFTDITGTFTHAGLWDGTEFIHAEPFSVTLPTAQDLVVLVEFSVEVTS